MDYRTALITGASSGLGRGLAAYFARRGVRVFAAARRAEALERLRAEVKDGRIEPFPLDVSNADEARRSVEALDRSEGGIDLVIANAGIGGDAPARALTWDGVEAMLKVNVMGAAATLTAALPGMIQRGHGHLVGISSLAATRGLPGAATYSASKAFLSTFLEGLRLDLAGSGVKVTDIQPGFVKSELTAKNRFKMPFLLETDDAVERMGRAIAKGVAVFAFPWPMTLAARTARWMPNALFERAALRVASRGG